MQAYAQRACYALLYTTWLTATYRRLCTNLVHRGYPKLKQP